MAGSSLLTVMTNILSLNSLNSVKTFRENSNVISLQANGSTSMSKWLPFRLLSGSEYFTTDV